MDTGSIRVLLVDDDEDDYIITHDLLAESTDATFVLAWVATYEAAVASIECQQYDVYLVDYQLGAYNGLDLLRTARAAGCQAPFILLTGQGDHEVDVEAMQTGAADYLLKGQIDAPLLERAIRYAIERKRTETELQRAKEAAETASRAE